MATRDMCRYCFAVLEEHFDMRDSAPPVPAEWRELKFPMFVTWKKLRRRRKELRGCIGTFAHVPLTSLRDYALTSALRDRRFPPMERKELPQLQCSVSLLTDFEDAAHPHDWAIGVHGIRVHFAAGGQRYTATYLPEVCAEQGWTHAECLASLVRKAGWQGAVDGLALRVERYRSTKAHLAYEEKA